jgi:hypothetical protein
MIKYGGGVCGGGDMSGACNRRDSNEAKCLQTVRKYEGKELLGRLSCRWENIIETDLK